MKKIFFIFVLFIATLSCFSQRIVHDHNVSLWYSQKQSISVEYTKTIGVDGYDNNILGAYVGAGVYSSGETRFTLGLDNTSYGYRRVNFRVLAGFILYDFSAVDAQLGVGIVHDNWGITTRVNLLNTVLGWGQDYEIWEIGLGYRF